MATHNGDWNEVLMNINPYTFGALGVAFSIALCIVGAAWGIFITGSTLVGAAIKAPRIKSKNLVSVLFCEASAIYGLIMAIILSGKLAILAPDESGNYPADFNPGILHFAGYATLASGLIIGLTNLASGVCVGVAGSSCALADAQNGELFVRILIVEIFGGALGIFGIIVSVIVSNKANWPQS